MEEDIKMLHPKETPLSDMIEDKDAPVPDWIEEFWNQPLYDEKGEKMVLIKVIRKTPKTDP